MASFPATLKNHDSQELAEAKPPCSAEVWPHDRQPDFAFKSSSNMSVLGDELEGACKKEAEPEHPLENPPPSPANAKDLPEPSPKNDEVKTECEKAPSSQKSPADPSPSPPATPGETETAKRLAPKEEANAAIPTLGDRTAPEPPKHAQPQPWRH